MLKAFRRRKSPSDLALSEGFSPNPGGKKGRANRKGLQAYKHETRLTGHEPRKGAVTTLWPNGTFWKILFQEGS